MFLDFEPSTTTSAILANNTSAADAFPGWPNGIPKPSAIGDGPFGISQEALVHIVPWWGNSSHPNIGYNSADPGYIARLVADLKRRGIAGASWLWNGAGGQMDLACLAMKPAFEAAGLKFAIMLSSTLPTVQAATDDAGRTKALNAIMDYLKSKYFSSPAYLRLPSGRPQVFFFGFANGDFDWTAVRTHIHTFGSNEPLCYFRMELNYGAHLCADGYFGWMDNSDAWVAFAKKFGKPLVIGVNGGFNNTQRAGTVANCTWGTPNVIDQQGGLKLQSSLAQAAKYPEITQAQVGTWNDYQEGTAIEAGIASGFQLLAVLTSNVLSWTPLTAAFEHAAVYLTNDGVNLMSIADGLPAEIDTLDLGETEPPEGDWQFVVVAYGKNSIQHVASNFVNANLGWR